MRMMWISLAVFVSITGAMADDLQPSIPDAKEVAECSAESGCYFAVVHPDVTVYAEPGAASAVIGKRQYGTVIIGKEMPNSAWIKWIGNDGWVRRDDLMRPRDFARVSGCWPIKSINVDEGDETASIEFKVDGTATFVNLKGQVFYYNKIMYVKQDNSEMALFTGLFDEANRNLTSTSSYNIDEVRFFSDRDLVGCGGRLKFGDKAKQ